MHLKATEADRNVIFGHETPEGRTFRSNVIPWQLGLGEHGRQAVTLPHRKRLREKSNAGALGLHHATPPARSSGGTCLTYAGRQAGVYRSVKPRSGFCWNMRQARDLGFRRTADVNRCAVATVDVGIDVTHHQHLAIERHDLAILRPTGLAWGTNIVLAAWAAF